MDSLMANSIIEKGIYDADCRFFAPYYRQAGLNVYEMESAARY